MRTTTGRKSYFLLAFIGLAVICFGLHTVQAQSKAAKAKPPKPPPVTYLPLAVDQEHPQIVCAGVIGTSFEGRLVQIKRTGDQVLEDGTVGKYEEVWVSDAVGAAHGNFDIGDADNDGISEIVAVRSTLNASSTKRKKLYDFNITGFESGSTGSPSWETPSFSTDAGSCWGCLIADIDGDGFNEIVTIVGNHVEILRITSTTSTHTLATVWTGPDYSLGWSLDVGDTDGDGDKEIVWTVSGAGAPIILQRFPDGTWLEDTNIETIATPVWLDEARIGDSDNDGFSEIVAGGNNKRLSIWKCSGGYYENVFLSDDLGGYTQNVGVGDIDGTEGREIVVGTCFVGFHIFSYASGYQLRQVIPLANEPVNSLGLADLDGDGISEIVSYTDTLRIYDYIGGTLVTSHEFAGGSYLKVR